MSGIGPKPTKLQMEVLKHAGILDDAVDIRRSAKKAVKRAITGGAKKAPSAWVQHVPNYAKQHNIPYKEAMSAALATYKR